MTYRYSYIIYLGLYFVMRILLYSVGEQAFAVLPISQARAEIAEIN